MTDSNIAIADTLRDRACAALHGRNLILVGLMGAGKSSVGKIVAAVDATNGVAARKETVLAGRA